jgi:hypothetical protein
LVEKHDIDAIHEVAENLHNQDKRVQIDCLAVMEQIGLLAPELIEEYVTDFIELIFSKYNRIVWAEMIDLALIADRRPDEIFQQYDAVTEVIDTGSVITKDNGIKTLAKVAAAKAEYSEVILPYLMEKLSSCRSKSVPQYAESIRLAINSDNQDEYLSILRGRFASLSIAQKRRVKKIFKNFHQKP